MIASIFAKKDCIEAVLNDGDSHRPLGANEIEKLRQFHQLLRTLEQATKRLGGDQHVSALIALLELTYLKRLVFVNDDDPGRKRGDSNKHF